MAAIEFPSSWAVLADGLKSLRGELPVREAAAAAHISKSALSRYEHADRVPPAAAIALDRIYKSDGWIEHSVTRLTLNSWSPWKQEAPATLRVHEWPAEFDGLVWFELRPTAAHVGDLYIVEFKWGSWRRRHQETVGVDGTVLSTAKAQDRDGVAVPLRLHLNVEGWIRFGAGPIDDPRHIDLSTGWTKIDE